MDVAAWLPRVAGLAASWLVGWAAQKGLTLNPVEVTGIMITVYSFLHRAISKKVNPGDAAKSVLIAEDKAVVKQFNK